MIYKPLATYRPKQRDVYILRYRLENKVKNNKRALKVMITLTKIRKIQMATATSFNYKVIFTVKKNIHGVETVLLELETAAESKCKEE